MPLVTVLIVTYNHARYIAEAIDSALAQVTDFDVEILISEDASTDGTRTIVEDYWRRFPQRIRLLLSDTNLRSNQTVARGLRAARGEFVALLDGDDYWSTTDKLQRQADFLLRHADCAAHFFNAGVARAGILTDALWTPITQAKRVDFREIWHGNPYATAGGMMRLAPIRDVPSWYDDFFPRTDWPLYILCAMTGNLAFDPESAAVYRLHEGGMFSTGSETAKLDSTFSFLARMDRCLERRHHDLARAGATRLFFDWAVDYLGSGQVSLAGRALFHSLRSGGIGSEVGWRQFLGLAVKLVRTEGKP